MNLKRSLLDLRRNALIAKHAARRMALRTVQDDSTLVEKRGSVASLVLARPKALNSLTLPMVRTLWSAFKESSSDPEVGSIVMTGAGEKAFCAGGDVRAVMEAARDRGSLADGAEDLSDSFFREEYALNAAIAGSPKPQVSLWDGIVMGGGAGVSVHGAFRVTSERTMFAMPETNIGLFPDVGATHFLSRLPGEVGTYLALTGARLGAEDLLYCGLATHYVPSDRLAGLEAQLQGCEGAAAVSDALARLGAGAAVGGTAQKVAPFLARDRTAIDECFAAESMEGIEARLRSRGGEWADATLATLAKMSPTSCKVTLRLLRGARGASLHDCLLAEFRACQQFMQPGSDFFEGIRAALVDKDRSPKWSPAATADVTEEQVAQYFKPLGARELSLPTLPGFAPVQSKI